MKTIHKKTLLYKRIDNSIIVSIKYTNSLNIINSNGIEEELRQFINNGETSIFLDFSKMKFIDTAGFQVLLSVHIDAKLNKVEFVILNANEEVLELFNLVELNNVFDLRNNLDSRYKMFRKAS
ncbi:STAS domain-containing protein [Bacteroidota bacterium]